MIGHGRLSLLIMRGPTGALTTIGCLISDFDENWLKGLRSKVKGYLCQNDTCQIIPQSDHPFKSYDQTSKCSVMSIIGRHIRFSVKILATSDTVYVAL